MPVNQWSDSADASHMPDGARGDATAMVENAAQAYSQAMDLLRDLHDAVSRLGDAFVATGFAPSEWRTTEALLSELSDQFPEATVDALLTRMAEFAAGTGPGWLRSDGAALDDFEHEARVLGDVIRPLRALAQRQRMTPARERGWLSLERALGDVRVGAQLDRISRTLRALMDVAPHLAPLTTKELAALDKSARVRDPLSAAGTRPSEGWAVSPDPWTGQHAPRVAGGLGTASEGSASTTASGIPIEDGGDDPDGPTYLLTGELPDAHPEAPTVPFDPSSPRLMRAVLGQRSRVWGLLLAIAVGLVAGTLVLTLALHTSLGLFMPGAATNLTGAQATAAAGALAREATATSAARAHPTATAAHLVATQPTSARLTVSPTSVVLPCPSTGNGVTLTLHNTGGQTLTWHASPPGNVTLSATDGALAPGASTTILARATAPQHGGGVIVFTWSGSSTSVGYKTACH